MAWKKVKTGDTIDIKTDEKDKFHIGNYLSKKEIEINGVDRIVWNFIDEKGKAFSIWGFTALNYLMDNVEIGDLCKIQYLGKSETKNKYGKFPHRCSVEISIEDIEPKQLIDEVGV